MRAYFTYGITAVLAVIVLGGNYWVVHSQNQGPCKPLPSDGCSCAVKVMAVSGSKAPTCSVVGNWSLGSGDSVSACTVQPGDLFGGTLVECNKNSQAYVVCNGGSTFSVASGSSKLVSCASPKKTVHSPGSSSWFNFFNLLGSDARSRRVLHPRGVVSSGPQPSFTLFSDQTVVTSPQGDAGFTPDDGSDRITVTAGQATVTSLCDGSTAQVTGPAVLEVDSKTGLFNNLANGIYNFAPQCQLDNASGTWHGSYLRWNSNGEVESYPFTMTIQSGAGTIAIDQDTLTITSITANQGNINLTAQSSSNGGSLTLQGTYSKGLMDFNGLSDLLGADQSDDGQNVGTASRLYIAQWGLPYAAVNVPYQQQLMGPTNEDGNITWSVTSGSLPAGLLLDPVAGVLSGTPAATGAYNFTVQAHSDNGDMAQQPLTLYVQNLILSSNILPVDWSGQVFQYTLQAQGGTPPYTFASTLPSIPGFPVFGPQISASGTITYNPAVGIPVGTGPLNFTVTDSQGLRQTMSVEFVVRGVTLTASQFLPDAPTGAPYSFVFPVSGNTGSVRYSTSTDLTGTGLTLDPGSGTLSGTSTSSASIGVVITASDGQSNDTRNFTLNVVDSSLTTTASLRR